MITGNNDRWSALSMKEKADLFKIYAANGYTSLDSIKEHYNKFADGGKKDTIPMEVNKEGNLIDSLEPAVITPRPVPLTLKTYPLSKEYPITHSYLETNNFYKEPTNKEEAIRNIVKNTERVRIDKRGTDPTYNLISDNCSDATGKLLNDIFNLNLTRGITTPKGLQKKIEKLGIGEYKGRGTEDSNAQIDSISAPWYNYRKAIDAYYINEYNKKLDEYLQYEKVNGVDLSPQKEGLLQYYNSHNPLLQYNIDKDNEVISNPVSYSKANGGYLDNLTTKPFSYQQVPVVRYADGGPFEKFYTSLPENQKDSTNFNVRRYWELNGKPKNFKEAVKKEMYTLEDDGVYHAYSVAYNKDTDEYEVMKSMTHPSRLWENVAYNSNTEFNREWEDLGNKYIRRPNNYVELPKSEIPEMFYISDLEELANRQRWAESRNINTAVSPRGAMGPYQIMPATLKEYQDKTGDIGDVYSLDYSRKVKDSILDSLSRTKTISNGNPKEYVKLAKQYAAYNWGQGNLGNMLQKAKEEGIDIYQTLDWFDKLPKETRDYVNFIVFGKDTGGHRINSLYNKSKENK